MKFISVMELQFEVVLIFYLTDDDYDVVYEETMEVALQMWLEYESYRALLLRMRMRMRMALRMALQMRMAYPKALPMAYPKALPMAYPKVLPMAYRKDSSFVEILFQGYLIQREYHALSDSASIHQVALTPHLHPL